jgi:hypothetical protein
MPDLSSIEALLTLLQIATYGAILLSISAAFLVIRELMTGSYKRYIAKRSEHYEHLNRVRREIERNK